MTDPVLVRLARALEGRYGIRRELGAGGMATVYLAEDLRHRRQVALKVLRPELAAVLGAERFLAEIETTASLQHPHILPLFDSGEADGFLFYVMPYVEGDSVRDRLDREKQLGVEETVELGRKVAAALDYAHEQGVVHRDVKPANILLGPRGEPLVADFGIALAVTEAGGGRITETGLSLGTPHYMSPEQATGDRAVGPRADVWALGSVVYEMLAGEPPFAAPTAQAVLARILTGEARPLGEVRRTVPPHVEGAVARALEKLSADRFESAAAFGAALADEGFRWETTGGASVRAASPGTAVSERGPDQPWSWLADRRSQAALGVGVALGLLAVALAVRGPPPPSPTAAAEVLPAFRFELTEEFFPPIGLAVAGDGTVVFGDAPSVRALLEGGLQVRRPGELRGRRLAGAEEGIHPTVSPDGQSVAFVARTELRRVALDGGTPVTLARSTGRLAMPHWGPDGTIAYLDGDGLYRVPEVGGTPERVYPRDGSGEAPRLHSPFILPEGAGWLVSIGGGLTPEAPRLLHLDPTTGETRLLVEGGRSGMWLPTGHVAYVHETGSLYAGPFDLVSARFTSPPVEVVDSLVTGFPLRPFAVSSGGVLAYAAGLLGFEELAPEGGYRIVLEDVAGGGEPVIPPLDPVDHPDGRLSPDGRRIAYTDGDQIFVFDLELGGTIRLTTEGSNHHDPVWSPDGTRVLFASERGSTGRDLWVKSADGTGEAAPVLQMEGDQVPRDWSGDGVILLTHVVEGEDIDLYTMPADGSVDPRPYLSADWDEARPRLSPDGRWLAYEAGDTDPPSIAVRSFPEPGPAHVVSEAATLGQPASDPVWSPDGGTLYYRLGSALLAVELSTDPEFRVVGRRSHTIFDGVLQDAHPDGARLLTFQRRRLRQEGRSRLVVVSNWFSELKERLGER